MMRQWSTGVIAAALAIGCSGEAAVDTGEVDASSMDTSEPWDLVWFSDSTGFGVAELWAEHIEQELDVEVRVDDRSAGGLPAKTVLGWINEDSSIPELRESLAEAEVVVIEGNPRGTGAPDDMETCISTSTAPRDPPSLHSVEDFEPYGDVLTSIYEIVLDLRGGEPTIVRAFDLYNPVIADWREAGIATECTAGFEAISETIREAAAEFGIPTASMFDAFNGPDHDEDPREKGFIGSDGEHTSAEGKAAQMEVLHALGYSPVSG